MFTPGAAIFTAGPKLLKKAKPSSLTFPCFSTISSPTPPHFPSLSPIAETVSTLGLFAGVVWDASAPRFPAEAMTVIPALTAASMALGL